MPAPHFFAQNGGVGLFNGSGVSVPEIAGKSFKYAGSKVQTVEQKFRIRFEDGSAIGQGSGSFRIKTGNAGNFNTWTVHSGQITLWQDTHLGRAGRHQWTNNGDYDLPHGWVNSYMQFYGTTGGNWDGGDTTGFRISNISGGTYGGVANNNTIGQLNSHSGWRSRNWNGDGAGSTKIRRHAGNFQDEDFGNEQGQTNNTTFKIRFF